MAHSVVFQAIVLLAGALIFVPLAKRLYLGSVFGYLIAGVIIGPFGLGLVGGEGKEIMHFAELGIVLMLFLIGLELEPVHLRRLRRFIVSAGLVQFLITTILVAGFFAAMGFPLTSALAVGMAMSMSSTVMVLQTMEEKGWSRTRLGETSLAVLLTQDVAVIPVLATLPLLAAKTSAMGTTFISRFPYWVHTLAIFAAVGIVLVSGKYLLIPFLRFIARSNLRELLTAAALFIVLSTAFFMDYVGVSPALGTFLAGVVLAGSEFRHQLQVDIEPFKGILLGLFFISIGAVIDFSHITHMPATAIGILIGVVCLKAVAMYVTGRWAGLGKDQSLFLAVVLSQVGEFAFVLLSFMDRLALITSPRTDILLFVTAMSMMISPMLLYITERFVISRLLGAVENTRASEVEFQYHPVLIAGFGPFGSTIGRFLRANGVESTILDNDADRVDVLRKMGFKAFFGDATRLDVLKAAGADNAKVFVAAIGQGDINVDLVEKVKQAFPHMTIMSRVQNPLQEYELMDRGERYIYRDSVDTAIRLGVDCLVKLGYRRYSAFRAGQKFLRYDEEAMQALAATRHDDKTYILKSRELIQLQEMLLLRDREFNPSANDHAWDSAARTEE